MASTSESMTRGDTMSGISQITHSLVGTDLVHLLTALAHFRPVADATLFALAFCPPFSEPAIVLCLPPLPMFSCARHYDASELWDRCVVPLRVRRSTDRP